jgi:hypothetical protein
MRCLCAYYNIYSTFPANKYVFCKFLYVSRRFGSRRTIILIINIIYFLPAVKPMMMMIRIKPITVRERCRGTGVFYYHCLLVIILYYHYVILLLYVNNATQRLPRRRTTTQNRQRWRRRYARDRWLVSNGSCDMAWCWIGRAYVWVCEYDGGNDDVVCGLCVRIQNSCYRRQLLPGDIYTDLLCLATI